MRRHALVVALVVAASIPFGVPGATSGGVCEAGAAPGTIRAAIVVDFGSLGGSNSVECITLPAGSNGYQLLAARASQLGVAAPRTDASGNFLCGIDGRPAQTCAIDGGDPNAYWSFWRATATTNWTYANVGMSATVKEGEVHGWRFVTSAGSSPDLAPRIAPANAACPAVAPATTTAPPTLPPATNPPASPSGGQTPVAVQPNAQLPTPATPGASATPGEAGVDTTSTTSPTTTSPTASTTSTSTPTSTTEVIDGTDEGVEFIRGSDAEPDADSDDDSDDEGGGSAGLLAALGVGAAAVALAFVQSRRTRLTK